MAPRAYGQTRQARELMAAMVAKVSRFAERADGQPLAKKGEVTVAVYMHDSPVGAVFKDVLDGVADGEVTWRVTQVGSPGEAARHPVVFLCHEAPRPDDKWYLATAKQGVLTFARARDGRTSGAVIGFVEVEGRMRFNVDLKVARLAGIRLNPRLLRLAHRVFR